MSILKKVFIKIFIGEKNVKYIGKYLLLIIIVQLLNRIAAEFVRGNEVSFTSIKEYFIIQMIVLVVGFRLWVKIFEGTQKFWMWVLK